MGYTPSAFSLRGLSLRVEDCGSSEAGGALKVLDGVRDRFLIIHSLSLLYNPLNPL
jgi:hypothetical protein